ncbi:MAG: OprO/OprP family phosphate-selective porin [Bacteroidia bacterium]|nr:OprO/OprP family phosphate-selective porin [Bacteroidia bacterium]
MPLIFLLGLISFSTQAQYKDNFLITSKFLADENDSNLKNPAFAEAKPVPKNPKFGKGISWMAPDSTFSTKFNLRMQHLYVATYDQVDEDWSSQFLVRRARLKWGGFALSPKLEYKVELGLSNRDISVNSEDGNTRDGSRIILDMVLKWKFAKNWALWVGQTKLPGNRERVISSANLQFVDRSLVNSRFNIDRDAGIQLRGKMMLGESAYISPSFAISQGEGRNITSNNFGGYNYTVHLDILPTGKFAGKGDYVAADLEREETPKIAFGLTYDYNDGAVRQGGQLGSFVYNDQNVYAENSLSSFIADMIFKYRGLSIASEYATRSADLDLQNLSRGFRTGDGFVVQAGYVFPSNIEISGRYTTIRRDNDLSGISDTNEITFGLSRYIVKHSLKVQTDISKITAPGESDGDIRFRAQVEMQF